MKKITTEVQKHIQAGKKNNFKKVQEKLPWSEIRKEKKEKKCTKLNYKPITIR